MERGTHRLCIDHLRLTKPPWTIESLKLLRRHPLQNKLEGRPNGTDVRNKQKEVNPLNKQGQVSQLNKQEQDSSLNK